MTRCRSLLAAATLALTLAVSVPTVSAALCDLTTQPSATLLIPYFEVDLTDPNGRTTLFSVNNAFSKPVLVSVTLWTDWAVPTLTFNVFLTGFDIQTLNLRDILVHGRLPQSGAGFTPQGNLSEPHVNPPGCNGGMTPGQPPVYPVPALVGEELAELQAMHTGNPSPKVSPGTKLRE